MNAFHTSCRFRNSNETLRFSARLAYVKRMPSRRSAIVRYLPFQRNNEKLTRASAFHTRSPCSASDHAKNSGLSLGASA